MSLGVYQIDPVTVTIAEDDGVVETGEDPYRVVVAVAEDDGVVAKAAIVDFVTIAVAQGDDFTPG
jgi:hypothetical protein